MTIKTSPAVAEYLARTKAALADLPTAEVEEIIEDIGQHLSEIAEELDEMSVEALSKRLGTPEQYAAELRAAAGYPPREAAKPPQPNTLLPRLALWGLTIGVLIAFVFGVTGPFAATPGSIVVFVVPVLVAVALLLSGTVRIDELAELSEAKAARRSGRRFVEFLPARLVGFVRSLRPAWVVLRTIAIAVGVLLSVVRPEDIGRLLLPLAALVVLLVFSSRARTDGRWRWGVAAANAYALGLTLVLMVAVVSVLPIRGNNVVFVDNAPTAGHPNNIYVFGPDGTPLTEVYLYDENGNPFNVWPNSCGRTYGEPTNKVPQPIVEYTDTGVCVERIEPPFMVAIPRSDAPTTAPLSALPSAPLSAPPSPAPSAPPSAPPSSAPATK